MTKGVIERYNNFNSKGCTEDLLFGDFNNQPIPPTYSDLTNDYEENEAPIYSVLADKEGV